MYFFIIYKNIIAYKKINADEPQKSMNKKATVIFQKSYYQQTENIIVPNPKATIDEPKTKGYCRYTKIAFYNIGSNFFVLWK